jgi:hypothetical protein
LTKGPYNPLDKFNLAKSIEFEVLSNEVLPLTSADAIVGAGVYIIYYRGNFPNYQPLAQANVDSWNKAIYVGKAIPKGGRKGGLNHNASASGSALSSRLRKHAESIRSTENLAVEDFGFRCIVLDDIWIPLGENILIENFKPLWNIAVDGFGINDPGKGRLDQKKSPWDVLHPGRGYADRLKGGGAEVQAIHGRIEDHFAGRQLRRLPKSISSPSDERSQEDDKQGDE